MADGSVPPRPIAARPVPRWRLAFPADGSAVFELTAALDGAAIDALEARVAELAAYDRGGLVVDLTAAGPLDAEQERRLLDLIGAERFSPLVVVTASAAALMRRIVEAGCDRSTRAVGSRDRVRAALHALSAEVAAPAALADGDLGERYRGAIDRSLHRAQRAAGAGDFSDALGWLDAVKAIDGRLPPAWERRRRIWERGARAERSAGERGRPRPRRR